MEQQRLVSPGQMEISADRAYWFFQSYSARSVRLHFIGLIAGEQAACEAAIVAVDRELQLIVLELFEGDGGRSWFRPITLRDATFHCSMMGEAGFDEWAGSGFHLVFVLQYHDGTTLLLAERTRPQILPDGLHQQ
jgi:hypothetical protein